jgi:RNA polymerase sigma-70 factor (sigma-E family)
VAADHEGTDDDYTEYVTAKIPWLRKIAYLLCQDWHRADDLTQTTIMKLYASWRRTHDHANLDGYVRTILVNTYISEQRTHWWKRVTLLNPTEPKSVPEADEAPDAALERDLELGLDLADALAAIPPGQRAVIVLRYYCDLSIEDTATALRCTPGTVKSQTWRGLAALRTRLAERAEPEPKPDRARSPEPGPAPSRTTA